MRTQPSAEVGALHCRCTTGQTQPPVLIVEDDDETARCLGEFLAGAGYRSCRAANGLAALHHVRLHGKPSVILLDLHLPVMDGDEVVRVLQREPEWRRIPVVLVTADPQARDRAIAMHASGYLKKPIAHQDLLAMVDSAVRYPA